VSVVRYFQPPPKLAKLLSAPGGKYISAAIADAADEMSQASARIREEIDRALAQIYANADAAPSPELLPHLYRAARDVAGLAGVCGLKDLGEAALSFCGLLDHAQEGGRLTVEHMAIYANVLRILRQSENASAEERAAVLANLDLMLAKISGRAAPPV
jgi:chemotaxis protein histidine kinase CheA